jgi:hypothetical protein
MHACDALALYALRAHQTLCDCSSIHTHMAIQTSVMKEHIAASESSTRPRTLGVSKTPSHSRPNLCGAATASHPFPHVRFQLACLGPAVTSPPASAPRVGAARLGPHHDSRRTPHQIGGAPCHLASITRRACHPPIRRRRPGFVQPRRRPRGRGGRPRLRALPANQPAMARCRARGGEI